jgi:hypothetical protein
VAVEDAAVHGTDDTDRTRFERRSDMNVGNRWGRGSESEVVCIACGAEVPRSGAREYDRNGDRWNRDGKRLEYLCKPCHRECCQQPREGLEATLVEAAAGCVEDEVFFERYYDIVGRELPTRYEDGG